MQSGVQNFRFESQNQTTTTTSQTTTESGISPPWLSTVIVLFILIFIVLILVLVLYYVIFKNRIVKHLRKLQQLLTSSEDVDSLSSHGHQANEEDQFQQNKNKMNSSNRTEQSENTSTTSSASQFLNADDGSIQILSLESNVNSSPKFEFSLNSRSSDGGISCSDHIKIKQNDSDCGETAVKYPCTPNFDSFSIHDINAPLLSKPNEIQLGRKSQVDSSGLFDGAQCNADACVGEPETIADCRINCNDPEQRALDDQMNHKQPNKRIYDILRKIPWVEGYYSEGGLIAVYVDFNFLQKDEQWILRYLTDITQTDLQFRILDCSEN